MYFSYSSLFLPRQGMTEGKDKNGIFIIPGISAAWKILNLILLLSIFYLKACKTNGAIYIVKRKFTVNENDKIWCSELSE